MPNHIHFSLLFPNSCLLIQAPQFLLSILIFLHLPVLAVAQDSGGKESENASCNATITAASAVCTGSMGNTASVPVASGNPTYTWSLTGGTITGGSGTESITYTADAGPSLTIAVTVTDGVCTGNGSLELPVNNPPLVTCAAPLFCSEDEPFLLESICLIYGSVSASEWSGPGVVDNTLFNPALAGVGEHMLNYMYTDQNGCSASGTIPLTVNATPDATITMPASVCAGSMGNIASVPLLTGGSPTYEWNLTSGTITDGLGTESITFTTGPGPSATLAVSVSDGTCSKSDLQELPVIPWEPLEVEIDEDEEPKFYCCEVGPDKVYLNELLYSLGIDTPPVTNPGLMWVGPGVVFDKFFDPCIAGSGEHILTFSFMKENGCTTSGNFPVVVNPSLDCSITGPNSVCANSIGYEYSATAGFISYAWSIVGDGIISGFTTGLSILVNSGGPGSFTLWVTANGFDGCNYTCAITVTVGPGIGPDSDCDGIKDPCDLCPGGDDAIDYNNDGFPDCILFPGMDFLPESWKCGNNNDKVWVCHNGGSLCVAQSAVDAHLNHNDYIGPCNNITCSPDFSAPGGSKPKHDLSGFEEFDIFPNPADGDFTILLDKALLGTPVSVLVLNALGQVVIARDFAALPETAVPLTTAALPEGLHQVVVRADGGGPVGKCLAIVRD